MLGFLSITISWSLPKFMFIASVMPSSHLILWHPLHLLSSIFPSIRDFSNESAVHIRWPKYWSFRLRINPSNEYAGLISLKIDWFDLAVQGTLRSLLQHHSLKIPILWCSAFFTVQLSPPYVTTGKTIALTIWTSVSRVMSLLFNTLSRLVITFLPRSKRLLISWLQSPSAVILEPRNTVGTRSIFAYWLNEWHISLPLWCSVAQLCPFMQPPWTAARQASLSLTISQSFPKYMSIASVMPSSHLILWPLLICSQSFAASGIFPMSQLFTSGDQNTGALALASVLPASI